MPSYKDKLPIQTTINFDTIPTIGSTNAVTSGGIYNSLLSKQDVLTNPVTGTGTAGQIAYFNGTSAVTGSANLFWDAVNGRLGVGTNAPNRLMQLSGADRRLLSIYNSGNNSSLIMFQNAQTGVADGDGFAIGIDDSENGWLHNYENTNTIFTTNATERLRITSAGNVLVGNTDGTGRLTVRGSGTTSATTALLVQNSGSTELFQITDNGFVRFRSSLITFAGITTPFTILHRGDITDGVLFGQNSDTTITSGNRNTFSITESFIPTSGTATLNILRIAPSINQTGGANGITRGLYVNPTLTAAADWRSIEWSNNTGWGLYGAGTANNYLAGALGIGTTSLTGSSLIIQRQITGATNPLTITARGSIQSDATGNVRYFNVATFSAAATFTTNKIIAYEAEQGSLGLGHTVLEQIGFQATGSLTGATSNYGFYGNIASGTGRWNLYMNGTAANYLAGDTSIGTTTSGGRLTVQGSGTTSATTALQVRNSSGSIITSILDDGRIAFGNATAAIRLDGNILRFNSNAGGTSSGEDFIFGSGQGNVSTTSGTFNSITVRVGASQSFNPTSGTGVFNVINIPTTINQTGGANGITRGLYVNPTLTSAADWRSVEFSNNTGWGLYGAGTANNYLGGSLGIGTTSLTGYNLRVDKQLTGLTTSTGIASIGTIQSDVTTNARMFTTFANTQASTFTLTNLYHYQAQQGNIGLNSVVTNQFGFAAEFNITGATNNYGFYGNIASGTGRWNLYMNGTAANYLAGNTSIGTTTSGGRLTVQGSGTTSATKAFVVNNATPTAIFEVLDNGRINQTIPGASTNTLFGTDAGANASLSNNNHTAFGRQALFSTTTAANCTAIGREALYSSNAGDSTAIGYRALYANVSGFGNTAIGSAALASVTSGNNVGIGRNAGSNLVASANNVVIGLNAARFLADGITALTTANNSVFLGLDTRAAADSQTNQIVIGYQAIGNGSNTATLGDTSITATYLRGNINYTDGGNFVIGTTTGTKIGTSTSQKLSFWGAAPDVQPTTAITAAAFSAGTSGIIDDSATFGGYTIGQIVAAMKRAGLLA